MFKLIGDAKKFLFKLDLKKVAKNASNFFIRNEYDYFGMYKNQTTDKKTEIVLNDLEVSQCLSTIEDKVRGLGYSIDFKNEKKDKHKDLINDILHNHLESLISLSLRSWVCGNIVYEIKYIRNENGDIVEPYTIESLQKIVDASKLVKTYTGDLYCKTTKKTYGRHFYQQIKTSDFNLNDAGDGLINKIYELCCHKKAVHEFSVHLLKNKTAPWTFINSSHGFSNTVDPNTNKTYAQMLAEILSANKPAAVTLDTESKVQSFSHNVNYDGFNEFLSNCNASIQKIILGQTLTSEIKGNGSYAASKTHKEVMNEKIQSFTNFCAKNINNFLKIVCEIYGLDLKYVSFRFNDFANDNYEKALRDEILTKTGLRFKKPHYLKNYKLEEEDFDILDTPILQSANKTSLSFAKDGGFDYPKKIDEMVALLVENHKDEFLKQVKQICLSADNQDDLLNKLEKLTAKNDYKDFEGLNDGLNAAMIYGFCDAEESKV